MYMHVRAVYRYLYPPVARSSPRGWHSASRTLRAVTGWLAAWLTVITAIGQSVPPRDLMSDTWLATDALGRELPGFDECGPPKANRNVGIFYFLWLGTHGTKLYDLSEIVAKNPANPEFGPKGAFHWWGRPHFDYYQSTDPWVIRRHAQMLGDAGVDALVFDVTNAQTYDNVVDAFGDTFARITSETGRRPPSFGFLTNTKGPEIARRLLDRVYRPGLHQPFWYMWKGRPLMLSDVEDADPDVRAFFSLRKSWAWTQGHKWFGDGRDRWPWLDHFPQTPGWHESPSRPEQISVCVAQHPVSNIGRSFRDGAQPPPDKTQTSRGLCFAEQWRRALEIKPEFVLITGWNEWVAQRFISEKGGQRFLDSPLPPGGTFFVDCFSQEFSRDIEPMRGGYADNYYYQMVAGIRLYKGVRPRPPASQPRTIALNGDFAQWNDVGPAYLDDLGDTEPRNHPGWGDRQLVNESGRNDFDTLKVARDETHLYFHATTVAPISEPEGTNWMTLLINADCDPRTGWQGFDVIINRRRGPDRSVSIEHNVDGEWIWKTVGEGRWEVSGNQLHLAVPIAMVLHPANRAPVKFDFKWSDNVPERGDPTDYIDQGDTAPNGRFRYRYETAR